MLTDALVVAEPGAPFKLQPIQVDEKLRDNEVLIKIKASGLCHTDLNFSKEKSIPGLFPAVFGHEGASSQTVASPPLSVFGRARYTHYLCSFSISLQKHAFHQLFIILLLPSQ